MADANFPYGEVASALGGGFLVKVVDFFTGRKSREVKSLSDQLERTDARLERFEKRLDECQESHEECERGRREDRQEIEGLKDQVAQLMRGEVPTYQPADLRRVARRRA